MIELLTKVCITLYAIALCGLTLYAIHLGYLTLVAILAHTWGDSLDAPSPTGWPHVTVQIPLRNERFVARRVLNHVLDLDYPKAQLHIQVLDDSTDDTYAIVRNHVTHYQHKGYDISLIHRNAPLGFKAGALANALNSTTSEYIALFDADFMPPSDFLKRVLPRMIKTPEAAMIQACWSHVNNNLNLITRAQALALDAHFHIDHPARSHAGLLMNFNGAAGIWRRKAILNSGGWSSSTLTEDLDLSYRAQIKGWTMLYAGDVDAPAELPPTSSELRSQQHRWAKGAAQCLAKLSTDILRSKQINIWQKIMAFLHLCGYFSQMLMLLMLFLSLPLTFLLDASNPAWFGILGLVSGSLLIMYYGMGQLLNKQTTIRTHMANIASYPVLVAIGLVTSLDNSLALLDGLRNQGGVFVRTAKYNLKEHKPPIVPYSDSGKHKHWTPNACVALYCFVTVCVGIVGHHFDFIFMSIAYLAAMLLVSGIEILAQRTYRKQKNGVSVTHSPR